MTHPASGLQSARVDEDAFEEADKIMGIIGRRVRERRKQKGLTLNQLSQRTGVSTSMLSMLERGLSSASVGTLVSVASALSTNMAELFEHPHHELPSPITRKAAQPAVFTPHGALRRVAHRNDRVGIEVAVNEYEPGGASGDVATHHDGTEFGLVISGRIRVEIDAEAHELGEGDSIEYSSARPHRISNPTGSPATAVWVNVGGRPSGHAIGPCAT